MDDKDSDATIGRMFALITTRFEDGAGLAIEGQRPTGKDIASLSAELDRYASDILLLLEAVEVVHRMRD